MKAGSPEEKKSDAGLDNLVKNADVAMEESEGHHQGNDAGVSSEQEGQAGSAANVTGEPEITQADAKDLSEFVIGGAFGLVEEIWPVVKFDEGITGKGVDRLTPLMLKHAATMFPLAGRQLSVLKIYKAYSDELKAIWFFSNVILQTVRVVRADKLKGNEAADDGQSV